MLEAFVSWNQENLETFVHVSSHQEELGIPSPRVLQRTMDFGAWRVLLPDLQEDRIVSFCPPLDCRNLAVNLRPGSVILPRKVNASADIEQPLSRRNLINLAHFLPEHPKDFDLHLVETFNKVVNLILHDHTDTMNPFEQLEDPT